MELLLLAQAGDVAGGLGGASGWAGAGLLGLVLAWMFFVHLPAKDKQMKEFLDAASKERDNDREVRRQSSNSFQAIVAAIHTEHAVDAKLDREAFEKRNSRLEDAIARQTAELKSAILGTCKAGEVPAFGKRPPHKTE